MKSYCEKCCCNYFDEETDKCECEAYEDQEEWFEAVLKERDRLRDQLEREYYRLVVIKEFSFRNHPYGWDGDCKGFKTFSMQKEFEMLIQPIPGMTYVFESEIIECKYLSYNVNEDIFYVYIYCGISKDIEEVKKEEIERGWVLV